MITADTITDEQIGGLAETLNCQNSEEDSAVYDLCAEATHAPFRSQRRAAARARLAEILNARKGT